MVSVRTSSPARPARRTQAERSETTRGLLLDATIDLLVEVGYARTTTQAVAERAGLSRGAQLHHFPTKADLVVAAVHRLAGRRSAEIRAEAERTGARGLPAMLDLLSQALTGRLFLASLELWVAARTDEELRAALAPLERAIGSELRRLAREIAGEAAGPGGLDAEIDLTLDLLRGLGVAGLIDPGGTRRRDRVLAAWRARLEGATG